jgi:hypothetical protein
VCRLCFVLWLKTTLLQLQGLFSCFIFSFSSLFYLFFTYLPFFVHYLFFPFISLSLSSVTDIGYQECACVPQDFSFLEVFRRKLCFSFFISRCFLHVSPLSSFLFYVPSNIQRREWIMKLFVIARCLSLHVVFPISVIRFEIWIAFRVTHVLYYEHEFCALICGRTPERNAVSIYGLTHDFSSVFQYEVSE